MALTEIGIGILPTGEPRIKLICYLDVAGYRVIELERMQKGRRILLAIFTYIAIGAYLQIINIPKPWLNAIVPVIAFMLSTLTLPFFKIIWEKYIKNL